MKAAGLRLETYARLGFMSLARVAAYRIGLKSRLHPVFRIVAPPIRPGDVFPEASRREADLGVTAAWAGRPWAFGREAGAASDTPPAWDANILSGKTVENATRRWDRLPAFGSGAGDIKTVWEASRFDWVLAFAQHAASGDLQALERLNAWLADWRANNPPYFGPNWMCGQEASIRVIHLAAAAIILGTFDQPSASLVDLLVTHLRRIRPTVSYALGQDNNHATSEAAALLIGGLWLQSTGFDGVEARAFAKAGRRLMDHAVQRLVLEDGGFSQYSIVYHRVMLDAVSMTQLVLERVKAPPLKTETRRKLALAAEWLDAMVVDSSGEAPNMGANDGAWLLPIGRGEARDFRPAVALASALFRGMARYGDVPAVRDHLAWLGVIVEGLPVGVRPEAAVFRESGMVLLEVAHLRAWLRAPKYKFRPSQCDALHLDLWHGATPVFVDSGSYSYADSDHGGLMHFGSAEAHNTVQFDGRDQMPRLGRFLLGSWVHAGIDCVSADCVHASYTDYAGATHSRRVKLTADQVVVTDQISGFTQRAVQRWRTPWPVREIDGRIVVTLADDLQIHLDARVDGQPIAMSVTKGEVSLFYQLTETVSVISLTVERQATIETVMRFVQTKR